MAIQIIDEYNHSEFKNLSEARAGAHRTGSIWGIVGPRQGALRPIGQWNSLEIRCDKDRIEVKLNGIRVVDADMSRFEELKDRPRRGFIGLANWNGEAYGTAFRNIRLQEVR
jgi:hypothetical protein